MCLELGKQVRSGAAGTRTPDLLLAKQPLYHLSYSPAEYACDLR
jgi:hypothetical protein